MTSVLVCVKRVPDISGEVSLTGDGQALETAQLGFTISDHEACAVELAVRIATATGGTATVATVGSGRGDRAAPQRARHRLHGGDPRGRRPRRAGREGRGP